MRVLESIIDSNHEFEQTPGDSEGQGSLVFCGLQSHKESDTTEVTEQQQISISDSC